MNRWWVGLVLVGLLLVGCSGPENASEPSTISTVASAPIAPPGSATASAGLTVIPTMEPSGVTPTIGDAAFCADGVELLGWSDALDKASVDGDEVAGLSALTWSGAASTYYALSDRGGRVYTLDFPIPDALNIVASFRLRDANDEVDESLDGEGIAVLPNGDLLVASETEPSIRQYTRDGTFITDLPVPERFLVAPAGRALANGTFESLALSPSGTRLFTVLEEPLAGDGVTDNRQSRLRIVRYDVIDGAFKPVAEYLYMPQPDQDVSEIAAISDEELLVLERGVSLFEGFSARIFRVSLAAAEDITPVERLEDADATPVGAELLVDIADCPSGDLETFGGLNPLLVNFESMAIGPPLADGRRSLIVGSDDNFESFLITRFLVFVFDDE